MAKNTVVTPANPGMKIISSFLITALVNMVVIFLANMLFPQQVVLGTFSISHTWAVVLSAITLALITIVVFPFLTEIEIRRGRTLSPPEMMGAYLVINFVGLWLITRASEIFGLGVTSWMIVLGLAIVLNLLQGFAVMGMDKARNST